MQHVVHDGEEVNSKKDASRGLVLLEPVEQRLEGRVRFAFIQPPCLERAEEHLGILRLRQTNVEVLDMCLAFR